MSKSSSVLLKSIFIRALCDTLQVFFFFNEIQNYFVGLFLVYKKTPAIIILNIKVNTTEHRVYENKITKSSLSIPFILRNMIWLEFGWFLSDIFWLDFHFLVFFFVFASLIKKVVVHYMTINEVINFLAFSVIKGEINYYRCHLQIREMHPGYSSQDQHTKCIDDWCI